MNVSIYADEMLFVNFAVNMAIVLISEKITGKSIKVSKTVLASFVISVTSFVAVISPARIYINFLSLAAIYMAMTMYLFEPARLKDLIKYFAAVKAGSVFINGTYLFIRQYLGLGRSVYFFIVASALAYIWILVIDIISKRDTYYHNVNIVCNNRSVNTVGFVDTGNRLVEPISKKPVMIAEFNAIKDLLPDPVVYICNKSESSFREIAEAIADDGFNINIRLIPYKSIGIENGMLMGFVADSADIDGSLIKKPVIAIYRQDLSRWGGYNTLLSPRHLGGV